MVLRQSSIGEIDSKKEAMTEPTYNVSIQIHFHEV